MRLVSGVLKYFIRCFVVWLLLWPLAHSEELLVREAWIREGPPVAKSLAGYMRLENTGLQAKTIVAVEATGFASAMLHQSRMEGDMAMMEHLDSVTILPGQVLDFVPGQRHIMLMMPQAPLKAGDSVEMTLFFADQSCQSITVTVRKGSPTQSSSQPLVTPPHHVHQH